MDNLTDENSVGEKFVSSRNNCVFHGESRLQKDIHILASVVPEDIEVALGNTFPKAMIQPTICIDWRNVSDINGHVTPSQSGSLFSDSTMNDNVSGETEDEGLHDTSVRPEEEEGFGTGLTPKASTVFQRPARGHPDESIYPVSLDETTVSTGDVISQGTATVKSKSPTSIASKEFALENIVLIPLSDNRLSSMSYDELLDPNKAAESSFMEGVITTERSDGEKAHNEWFEKHSRGMDEDEKSDLETDPTRGQHRILAETLVESPDTVSSSEFFCASCVTPILKPGVTVVQVHGDSVPVTKVLSTIFEFSCLVSGGNSSVFGENGDYVLCNDCASHLQDLYISFTKFTTLLNVKGKILSATLSRKNKETEDLASAFTGKGVPLISAEKRILQVRRNRRSARGRKKKEDDIVYHAKISPQSTDSQVLPKRKTRGRFSGNGDVNCFQNEHRKAVGNSTTRETESLQSDRDIDCPYELEWAGSRISVHFRIVYDLSSGFNIIKNPSMECLDRKMEGRSKTTPKSTRVLRGSKSRAALDTDNAPQPESKEESPEPNKRIRNWRKDAWIEKAQSDPSRTCDLCGKSFIFPAVMKRHKRIVHQGLKPYECGSCGKSFTQKVILNKHTCDFSKEPGNRDFLQMTREEQLRKFVCNVCGKRFKYPTHLSLHEMNHRDERPFPCTKCSKSFRRPDHLKYHVRIVHVDEKKFICTKCGQTLKSISSLRAHEKKHLSDEGHLCNICGKSIKSMYQMSRHQKTHQDELPFECPVCGKRFKMKDYLGQHLRRGKSCSKKLPYKEKQGGSMTPETAQPESCLSADVASVLGEIPNSNVMNVTLCNTSSRVNEIVVSAVELACFATPATVGERLLTEL